MSFSQKHLGQISLLRLKWFPIASTPSSKVPFLDTNIKFILIILSMDFLVHHHGLMFLCFEILSKHSSDVIVFVQYCAAVGEVAQR